MYTLFYSLLFLFTQTGLKSHMAHDIPTSMISNYSLDVTPCKSQDLQSKRLHVFMLSVIVGASVGGAFVGALLATGVTVAILRHRYELCNFKSEPLKNVNCVFDYCCYVVQLTY